MTCYFAASEETESNLSSSDPTNTTTGIESNAGTESSVGVDVKTDMDISPLPHHNGISAGGHAWDLDALREAIRDVQGGKIRYTEFRDRVVGAGVVEYLVFFGGGGVRGRVVYVGDCGDLWVEMFP